MKSRWVFLVLFIWMAPGAPSGSIHAFADLPPEQASPPPVILTVSPDRPANQPAAAAVVDPMEEEYMGDEFDDYAGDHAKEEKVSIADPLEPFNRAMHEFNDKMYFWAVKPVARGYQTVVPEPARISVENFFSNLGFPARFLSCLLQADFKGAATEAGRFTINTVWGIGGLLDPSSGKELNLQAQNTDLGQTLGVWGVGQGFYVVWPVFGPSTHRDTVSIAGNYFLDPVACLNPWSARLGVNVLDKVNAASLRIGDYEALKNAAIDPYVAFRDAYIQYRYKQIKARKARIFSGSSAAEPFPETVQPDKVD